MRFCAQRIRLAKSGTNTPAETSGNHDRRLNAEKDLEWRDWEDEDKQSVP